MPLSKSWTTVTPLSKTIALILFAFLPAIAFFFGVRYQQRLSGRTSTSLPSSTEIFFTKPTNNWYKAVSSSKKLPSQQGFPIKKQHSPYLWIYSFANKKSFPTKVLWGDNFFGSGALGFGTSAPFPSHDLLYTALIGINDNELWLMANDTGELIQITQCAYVQYLTDWSPNSKKLVFYNDVLPPAQAKNECQESQGYATLLNYQKGFYEFDLATNEITFLYPLSSFTSFIDNDQVLGNLTAETPARQKSDFDIFDTSSFIAKFNQFPVYEGEIDQPSFSSDRKKWVFYYSQHPTDDSNLIYADFPSVTGKTVLKGAWAAFNFPILTPDGKSILYSTTQGTRLYHLNTEKIESFDNNYVFQAWKDATHFIGITGDSSFQNVYLIDTTTRQAEALN